LVDCHSTGAGAEDEPGEGNGDGDAEPDPDYGDGESESGPGVGNGDDGLTPGTPSTEARDAIGTVQIGPVLVDWSSLWIGTATILGVTLMVGAWMLRERRR